MQAKSQLVPLGIDLSEGDVHVCDHVAYFWETEKEFEAASGFLATGLRGHDHCVVFGYEDANERVLDVLRRNGFDPERLKAQERLSVLTADESGEATLAKIGAA